MSPTIYSYTNYTDPNRRHMNRVLLCSPSESFRADLPLQHWQGLGLGCTVPALVFGAFIHTILGANLRVLDARVGREW